MFFRRHDCLSLKRFTVRTTDLAPLSLRSRQAFFCAGTPGFRYGKSTKPSGLSEDRWSYNRIAQQPRLDTLLDIGRSSRGDGFRTADGFRRSDHETRSSVLSVGACEISVLAERSPKLVRIARRIEIAPVRYNVIVDYYCNAVRTTPRSVRHGRATGTRGKRK